MDLRKEILKEHTKAQVKRIVAYVGTEPLRFENLVNIYLEGPYRVTQRAAWPISHCVENHPELIKPHLKKMLDFLKKPGIHNSVKRNTIRLLQFIEIPKKYYGQIAQVCFDFLQSKKEPVAVKAFSMTVLGRIFKDEPDLVKELQIIIEDQLPYASPGFIARARIVLNELEAKPKKQRRG